MAHAIRPIDEKGAIKPFFRSFLTEPTPMRSTAITLAAFALGLLTACELALAFPVAGWLYLAVGALFAVGLIRPIAPRRQMYQIGALALVLAASSTLYFVDWSTRKPFLRDLARVRVGMSEAEVRHVMAGYKEGTGWPTPPRPSGSSAKPDDPDRTGPPPFPGVPTLRRSRVQLGLGHHRFVRRKSGQGGVQRRLTKPVFLNAHHR
jgi:hypothetical protein